MTTQDRNVLISATISGVGMLICLTGLGWAVVGLLRLVPKRNGA